MSIENQPNTLGAVYVLFDPRNSKVPKYIGKTTKEVRSRLWQHLAWSYLHREAPLSKWLFELDEQNILPTVTILESCPVEILQQRETHWIRFYKPLGSLLNRSEGDGCQGIKGRMPSLENRLKTIERNKLGWTPTMRKNFLRAVKGRRWSPERLEAWRNRPGYADWLKKIRAFNQTRVGSKLSPETKAKWLNHPNTKRSQRRFSKNVNAAKERKLSADNSMQSVL